MPYKFEADFFSKNMLILDTFNSKWLSPKNN